MMKSIRSLFPILACAAVISAVPLALDAAGRSGDQVVPMAPAWSGIVPGCVEITAAGGESIQNGGCVPDPLECPENVPNCTPILIDLENDGVHLTGLENPVWFDIDADGQPNRMSWTDGGEGFLVLDRNGNGRIEDGGELFGNATRLVDGALASNGYEALAELDSPALGGNKNGVFDSRDAGFQIVQVWTDGNHDGISQEEELQTLSQAGIQRIGLTYRRSGRTDRHGNEFVYFGRAWKTEPNGQVRPILTWDVVFLVEP